jgi:RND family efflux transporter MFP subunit
LDKQVAASESNVEQAAAALDNAREALDKANADVNTATANVRKAGTDLDFYATELGRYNGLAQQGAVSYEDRDARKQAYSGGQATLDSLKAAERSSRASVNSAKAAVHVAKAALDAARAQKDQYTAMRSFRVVTAPFDGIVTKRNVDAGALISAGSNTDNTLLFEVAQTYTLRVFVYVPEQYVPYMKVGENARLRFQAYKGREFTGIVSNISGGVDNDSRTLQVEIHVPNAKHELLPGMYTTVSFECPAKVRLPVVPATTVQTQELGTFAFTVDDSNVVHKRKLLVARDLGGKVEVEQGLSSGDKVIVSPSDLIHDGMTVQPVLEKISEKGQPG